MVEVKIIADSVCEAGPRLTTFQLRYWRAIHSEFMTHRVFSRNASSSRAIPIRKMLEQVRNSPASPIYWGTNKPGMQAGAELEGEELEIAKQLWLDAAESAASHAEALEGVGLHKQIANRVTEPFQYISTIVTATDWTNFWNLRCHPDAQPEIQELAEEMYRQYTYAETVRTFQFGDWHLPYITVDEQKIYCEEVLAKMSTARCARVSYLTHDGKVPTVEEDLALFKRLMESTPRHASPAEHAARCMDHKEMRYANFTGWQSYRNLIEERVVQEAWDAQFS